MEKRSLRMRFSLLLILAAGVCLADERATVTGKVADSDGKPVEHATVLVYSAGVKKGYAEYCPTCWADCGKKAITDAEGSFSISGLNPDLIFKLLVLRDGYSAKYVEKVDPAKGPAATATLKTRPAIDDEKQVVRGLVVDIHGRPLRDAVIEQQGVTARGPQGVMTRFGNGDGWIDEMAVTNEKGEFEMAYGKPAIQMILNVNARGMAPKLFTESTGSERQTLTVGEGATLRGRVMFNGKPVANAEVGLVTHSRSAGTNYSEVRIGTKEDGTFVITNVPAGRIWMIYPKMESVAARGIGGHAVPVETKDDGQEVDVGDIPLVAARTVRGKVVLSDGKPIPPDMRVTLGADQAWDTQMATIGQDGSFEFHGVVDGVYTINPSVRGYWTGDRMGVEVLVNGDRNLTIPMTPAPPRLQ
jgi:Carboxypeptidase regulatory-like domain